MANLPVVRSKRLRKIVRLSPGSVVMLDRGLAIWLLRSSTWFKGIIYMQRHVWKPVAQSFQLTIIAVQ